MELILNSWKYVLIKPNPFHRELNVYHGSDILLNSGSRNLRETCYLQEHRVGTEGKVCAQEVRIEGVQRVSDGTGSRSPDGWWVASRLWSALCRDDLRGLAVCVRWGNVSLTMNHAAQEEVRQIPEAADR